MRTAVVSADVFLMLRYRYDVGIFFLYYIPICIHDLDALYLLALTVNKRDRTVKMSLKIQHR